MSLVSDACKGQLLSQPVPSRIEPKVVFCELHHIKKIADALNEAMLSGDAAGATIEMGRWSMEYWARIIV